MPACNPESAKPFLEIARPSCANWAQVKCRYSFVGQDADKPAATALVQPKAVAVDIMMPRKRTWLILHKSAGLLRIADWRNYIVWPSRGLKTKEGTGQRASLS
jgi:hypothetical protein